VNIGITGSAGKTTTKEMVVSILRRKFRVFKTKGNYNAPYHTRKYAKEIKQGVYGAVVLEYGMNGLGQIKRHCKYVRPDLGVITNVGTAHIGKIDGTVQGIARAKSELIHQMNPSGTLFINADDVNSKYLAISSFPGKVVRVSMEGKADYVAKQFRYSGNGMAFVVHLRGQDFEFFIPTFGFHNIYNALFAIAIADKLGISVGTMQVGLRSFLHPGQRLAMHRLRNGVQLIDDTFSSNPHAAKAAIKVLKEIGHTPTIAVLGGMREMGSYSSRGHREVGAFVASKKVDYLFTFGDEARQIREGAISNGYSADRAKHFANRNELHRAIVRVINEGATILVKGSHGVHMEITSKFIRQYYGRGKA
jgi:UDP-N-acetylmuramoyl-tripeptide--D-alanyl-D-alanine ligase